jgi:putative oxidoreductase
MKNVLCSLREKLSWLPPLLARITVGYIFIESGWGKLHNLSKVIEFFTQLGIPAPQIQAPFVATVEFVCGLLVFLGAFTRLASVPLIGVMIVAIWTAKLNDISGVSDLFATSEYLYILLLLWLAIAGGGSVSVDRFICRKSHQENA